MQIATRAQAAARGSSQYFTGKPCKSGHVTYRYTQSGTCSACIAAATAAHRAAVVKLVQAPRTPRAPGTYATPTPRRKIQERRDRVADLVEIKLRAYAGPDADMLVALAAKLCIARYPILTPSDVHVRVPPGNPAGGTALYRVRVPLESVEFMRQTAAVLLNAHRPDLATFHARQVQQVEQFAPAAVIPEWTFQ